MLTVRGTPEEVAGDVLAEWEEISRIPTGRIAPAPERRIGQDRESDVLDELSPPDYVQALTGVEVPHHGMICCPLPGHDDRTPSFMVYSEAERGWYCFGCARGGTIYDLGAEIWGKSTRGAAFHDLRRELARQLLRSEP